LRKSTTYYQLAHNHNHWDADHQRSKVEVIHSFGRADELDLDALRRLCRSIGRDCGLEVTEGSGREASEPSAPLRLVRAMLARLLPAH